jgi:quercetin dioxygenase-like cupin family protein
MNKTCTIAIAVLLTSVAATLAQEQQASPAQGTGQDVKIARAAEIAWRDAPGLPPGAQVALLDGDPAKEGSFTIRLKIPAAYKIPPHLHETAERITVISGAVQLGIGAKLRDGALRELRAGDFAVVPAGVPHFAQAREDAVLQIQSEGPFRRTYVDPADEPPKR